MACCSSTKTEQLVSKTAETAKAFAAEAEAFINSPLCLTPEALYLAALRFVHGHLGLSFADFELRNRCAEVRCCSWSQREGRVSDRKTGMCRKRVVDHKIPALASAISQG